MVARTVIKAEQIAAVSKSGAGSQNFDDVGTCVLTHTPGDDERWLYIASGVAALSNRNQVVGTGLIRDGIPGYGSINLKPGEVGTPLDYRPFGFIQMVEYGESPGSQTLSIKYGGLTANPTKSVRQARLVGLKLGDDDYASGSTTVDGVSTNDDVNWTDLPNAVISVPDGDYIVIATATIFYSSGTDYDFRVIIDGVAVQTLQGKLAFITGESVFGDSVACGPLLVTLSGGGSHEIKLQYKSGDGGSFFARYGRVAALAQSGWGALYDAEQRAEAGGTDTSYQDFVTLNPDIEAAGDHLILAGAWLKNSSTTVSSQARLYDGSADIFEPIFEGRVADAQKPWLVAELAELDEGSGTTWRIQRLSETSGATTTLDEASIVILQLEEGEGGGETHQGAASLVGEAGLTGIGRLGIKGTANLSAAGTLTAAGGAIRQGAASISAEGTLTAAGGLRVQGAASLSAAGTLSTTGRVVKRGASSLTAAASLTASANPTLRGSATMQGAGSLSVAASPIFRGAASLSAGGVLDATARYIARGAALLEAAASLEVSTGSVIRHGEASLMAEATLAAEATRRRAGTASLSATAALQANGRAIMRGAAALAGQATLTASGLAARRSSALLAGAAGLNATGGAIRRGDASLVGSASLHAVGGVRRLGQASLVGQAILEARGRLTNEGQVIRGSAHLRASASIEVVARVIEGPEGVGQDVAFIPSIDWRYRRKPLEEATVDAGVALVIQASGYVQVDDYAALAGRAMQRDYAKPVLEPEAPKPVPLRPGEIRLRRSPVRLGGVRKREDWRELGAEIVATELVAKQQRQLKALVMAGVV